MTGRPPRPTAAGVYTFRYRQSSDVLVVISPVAMLPIWAHVFPGQVAFLMPVHGAAGCGGRHRRTRTGGAAYGMPKNSRALPAYSPRAAPLSVCTTSGAGLPDVSAAAGRTAVTELAVAAPVLALGPAATSPSVNASGSCQRIGRTTRRRNAIAGSSPWGPRSQSVSSRPTAVTSCYSPVALLVSSISSIPGAFKLQVWAKVLPVMLLMSNIWLPAAACWVCTSGCCALSPARHPHQAGRT